VSRRGSGAPREPLLASALGVCFLRWGLLIESTSPISSSPPSPPPHTHPLPNQTAPSGALNDWSGTIIAITHNRSFAESLQASHILRVQGGGATLSVNTGLSVADFDHAPATAAPAAPAAGGKNGNAAAAAKGSGGKTVKASKSGGKQQQQPAAAAPQQQPKVAVAAAAPSAAKPPAKRRTTLSFKEREEYEKLCKAMQAAGKEQAALEAEVAQLAADPAARAKLEAMAAKLAQVVGKQEEMELRWLELAELAGDL